MDLAVKNVLVVGMARSGIAAVELLLRHHAVVTATDVRALDLPALRDQGVPFVVQSPDVFRERDLIVISPGVPADLPELEEARAHDIPVIGELELAGAFLQGKVLGITGSNGKTTTTALTGHILQTAGIAAQVGGNIGRPPAGMVATSAVDQWNVLELSSFQLETIRDFRVHIAAVLNITPDHLDRHHSLEAYAEAKRRIFRNQTPDDFTVLNAADEMLSEWGSSTRAQTVWFSSRQAVSPGIWVEHGDLVYDGEPFLAAKDIPLRGSHNVENVMAAAAAAHLAGASLDAIARAVKTFPGVEHRIEYVATVAGVDYYNDSKATNVDATWKAIDAFAGRLWIILGGKDKDSDYRVLRAPLADRAREVLLIGAAADKIEKHLTEAGAPPPPLRHCGTLEQALRTARAGAQPGDTVLLAPACASFDQFESYEHRGRVFKQVVAALQKEAEG